MQLAMIGLGRMGGNMVKRLAQGGHELVVYDRSADAVRQLTNPRVVWLMLPAGNAVESTIAELADHLSRDDILIDGGNSNFHDSMRRAGALQAQGIEFVDVGVSGGIWGVESG